MDSNKPLTQHLRDILNIDWSQFCADELSTENSSVYDVVLSLVRAVKNEKLSAIRLALDRLDGTIEKKVRVETPKFFVLYPYATGTTGEAPLVEAGESSETGLEPVEANQELDPRVFSRDEMLKMSLRETLSLMSGLPGDIPRATLLHADAQELFVKEHEPLPPGARDPMVKSVMAAAFLEAAKKSGDMRTIAELFDQIEGKVEKVLRLVGEDVYITSFDEVAPEGAYLNDDGVYQFENKAMTTMWKTNMIGSDEGDEDGRYNE